MRKLDALQAGHPGKPSPRSHSSDHANPMQWDEAGLHPIMMENIRLCQFDRPTPVQSYGIPAVLNNRDLIGIAQTGKPFTA